MLSQAAILVTALLFGGMVLYSFGFASFLFSALPADAAGPLLRRAFPHFYLFVIACALGGAALTATLDRPSALILGLIAVTALLARKILMPAINRADRHGQSRSLRHPSYRISPCNPGSHRRIVRSDPETFHLAAYDQGDFRNAREHANEISGFQDSLVIER